MDLIYITKFWKYIFWLHCIILLLKALEIMMKITKRSFQEFQYSITCIKSISKMNKIKFSRLISINKIFSNQLKKQKEKKLKS